MAKNPKMVMCRNCSTVIAANAKICPACGAKNKKPFYKRAWFITLVVIVAIGVIASGTKGDDKEEKNRQADVAAQVEDLREFEEVSPVKDTEKNSAAEAEKKERGAAETAEEVEKDAAAEVEDEEASGTEDEEQSIAAEPEETEAEEEQADDSAIDPDFKAAMDSYEAFMDEYIAFMKKYQENPTDTALLLDYTNYMSKYAQFVDDFSKWESADMNTAEWAYYAEVSARVSKKLLEVSQ